MSQVKVMRIELEKSQSNTQTRETYRHRREGRNGGNVWKKRRGKLPAPTLVVLILLILSLCQMKFAPLFI